MNKYSADFEAFMMKDDLEGVIRFLKVLPESDGNIKSKLSALKGRLSKLESDRILGILSQSEYTQERNQIRYGIIQTATDFELSLNRKEELESKKQKIILSIKKYVVVLAVGLGLLFLCFKVYSYFAHVNSFNIPYKYVNSEVDKESLQTLYYAIEADSTLGNKTFNGTIEYLYSISRGRDNYIKFSNIDTTSTFIDQLVNEKEFNRRFDGLLGDINKNDITYDRIYTEIEYVKQLREDILYDSIQSKYRIIDDMCIEIQNEIDRKIKNYENIKRNLDVELFNVKLNKSKRRLEARKNIKNGTGLTLYSVQSSIFICNRKSGDTLSRITVEINRPEGIDAVYTESLDTYSFWDQPDIYNALKKYNKSDFFYLDKILEVNADGENYEYWIDRFTIENLPHGGYFWEDKNYKTSDELTGYCPYLRYSSKESEQIRKAIDQMIEDNLEENGFVFKKLLDKLSIYE